MVKNVAVIVVVVAFALTVGIALTGVGRKPFPVEMEQKTATVIYIRDIGFADTETYTRYFISYSINNQRSKPILAVFATEKEKFDLLTYLSTQGQLIWVCDFQ